MFASILTFGFNAWVNPAIEINTSSLPPLQETLKDKNSTTLSPDTPDQLHNLVLEHKSQGEFETAVNLLMRALASDEKTYLLVISGWALSSASIVPLMKFGKSRVSLVAGIEIGSKRYSTGIMWFSSWIANPI